MKIYTMVTQSWSKQDLSAIIKDRTQNLRKGEQPILYATHFLDLLQIPIKFHEDICKGY